MTWDSFRSIWPGIICGIRIESGFFELTTESIMTSALLVLGPTDTVADALSLMHSKEVRDPPVVDKSGAQTRLVSSEMRPETDASRLNNSY